MAFGLYGCAAAAHQAADPRGSRCEFVVHNQTPASIDVRLAVSTFSTVSIGALNAGEVMTHAVPCAQGQVLVLGVEIPWQVGAPRRFGAVYAEAVLVEGERVRVPLQFP